MVINLGTATTATALASEISAADALTAGSGAATITVGDALTLTAELPQIALASGVTLLIDGGSGETLDAAGFRGLFVVAGSVTVSGLAIENASASGANGSTGGGGGGAGLGGGMFVGAAANVTLVDVTFSDDSAIGGSGGVGSLPEDGAGGLGLDGGTFGAGAEGGNRGSENSGTGSAGGPGGAAGFGGGGGGGGGGGLGVTYTTEPGGNSTAVGRRVLGHGGPGGAGGAGGFGAGAGGAGGGGGPTGHSGGGGGGGGLGAGGDVFVQDGGVLTLEGGTLSGARAGGGNGGAAAADGKVGGAGSGLGEGIFLQGDQTLTLAPPSGQTETIDDQIVDFASEGGTGAANIVINGAGTVSLAATFDIAGGVTIEQGSLIVGDRVDNGASGSYAFAGPGVLDVPDEPTEGGGADGVFFHTAITGFSAGDTIELGDIVAVTLEPGSIVYNIAVEIPLHHTFNLGTQDIPVTLATGETTIQQIGSVADGSFGGYPLFDFSFAAACYLRGTRIATVRGDIPIEVIAVGDLVLTRTGRLAPVRWIGRRDFDARRHPAPANIWPVRVHSGAFGKGEPCRALFLSPDHAVYVDGALIPIRCLINSRTISQVRHDAVSYWHIELDRHDVIFAEGLACESYLDTGNRDAFANGGGAVMLHPQFSTWVRDADSYAPLVVTGAKLNAARRNVAARAVEAYDRGIPNATSVA